MKIIILILLSIWITIANAEYPRFKRRGPQMGPPRPQPLPPQYGKKWQKPPQKMHPQFMQNRPQQIRARPIPMHNQAMIAPVGNTVQYQYPMGINQLQQQQQRPPQQPLRQFWKNPVPQGAVVQFPKERGTVNHILPKQEKPFLSSPTIPQTNLEYDYHIQTNNIPINTNPIKQVGEKGPIHTIPAPNLSPADKPNNIEVRKKHFEQAFQSPQYVEQSISQYQVTEPSEQAPKQLFRTQISPNTHQLNQIPPQTYQTLQPNQQPPQDYQQLQQVFFTQENPERLQDHSGLNPGYPQNLGYHNEQPPEDMMFSNTKHYQTVNSFQNQPGLQTQAIQSSYIQQQPHVLTQQFLQEDPEIVSQYNQENFQVAADKSLSVRPDFQSFNYDEQAHQAQAKSGFVTATYSLGSSDDAPKSPETSLGSRNSLDALTQAQIVQSYFDTRSEATENSVEPDAKPSASENEMSRSKYYSSLPSKEAAERLAKLQAAGKVNSSLIKISSQKTNNDMSIYVPEEEQRDKEDRASDDDREESVEYEDYSQEEERQSEEADTGFGHKVRSRT